MQAGKQMDWLSEFDPLAAKPLSGASGATMNAQAAFFAAPKPVSFNSAGASYPANGLVVDPFQPTMRIETHLTQQLGAKPDYRDPYSPSLQSAQSGPTTATFPDPFGSEGFGTEWVGSSTSSNASSSVRSTASLPAQTPSSARPAPQIQTARLQTSLEPPRSRHRPSKSIDISSTPPALLQRQRSKSVETAGATMFGVSRHPNWISFKDEPVESPATLRGEPSPVYEKAIRHSRKASEDYKNAANEAIAKMAEQKKREESLNRRGKREGLGVGSAGYYLDM